ncbi:arylesterase [Nitrosococcus wardiae]|uniref:Arylesterase n=1 Tax=Nitrosococcus wardiae TaxID=1814290 RepID=A0A4P7C3L6_9GAMM|nr:arylesterase [Nitrosococcus wardiae]QBQ55526.1 arylesterase [Nitrosococcus wardiae]
MNTIHLHRIGRLAGFGLLWGTIVIAAACSLSDSPRLSKLPADGVILAFGDSLTYGTGAGGSQYSYPSILEERVNRQVINAGVPGELSHQGLARLPEVLDQYQPHLVVLCHGGNDLLRKQDDAQIAANLRGMIELIQDRGIEVILLAVPRPAVFFMDAADFYAGIAREYQIPIDSETLLRLEKDPALKSDQIHLNQEGYRQLADAVVHLLNTSNAI